MLNSSSTSTKNFFCKKTTAVLNIWWTTEEILNNRLSWIHVFKSFCRSITFFRKNASGRIYHHGVIRRWVPKRFIRFERSMLSRHTDIVQRSRHTGNSDWTKRMKFHLSVYCTRFNLRPGPVRPCPTGNRSRFCKGNFFFISAEIELKFYTVVEQALDCMFFPVAKM